jgi:hypothetical protein
MEVSNHRKRQILIEPGLIDVTGEKLKIGEVQDQEGNYQNPEHPFHDTHQKTQDSINPYNIESFEDLAEQNPYPGEEHNNRDKNSQKTDQIENPGIMPPYQSIQNIA